MAADPQLIWAALNRHCHWARAGATSPSRSTKERGAPQGAHKLAACVKGREISLSVLPDYESGTTVKAKADGSFEWKYHTTFPEGDEVSAFADVDVLERTQKLFHKCGKVGKTGPVARAKDAPSTLRLQARLRTSRMSDRQKADVAPD
jgi:hypothetical protein